MYQGHFQDFSEFALNAYLSTSSHSISKNSSLGFWVATVTRQKAVLNLPKNAQNEEKISTREQMSLYAWFRAAATVLLLCSVTSSINF